MLPGKENKSCNKTFATSLYSGWVIVKWLISKGDVCSKGQEGLFNSENTPHPLLTHADQVSERTERERRGGGKHSSTPQRKINRKPFVSHRKHFHSLCWHLHIIYKVTKLPATSGSLKHAVVKDQLHSLHARTAKLAMTKCGPQILISPFVWTSFVLWSSKRNVSRVISSRNNYSSFKKSQIVEKTKSWKREQSHHNHLKIQT